MSFTIHNRFFEMNSFLSGRRRRSFSLTPSIRNIVIKTKDIWSKIQKIKESEFEKALQDNCLKEKVQTYLNEVIHTSQQKLNEILEDKDHAHFASYNLDEHFDVMKQMITLALTNNLTTKTAFQDHIKAKNIEFQHYEIYLELIEEVVFKDFQLLNMNSEFLTVEKTEILFKTLTNEKQNLSSLKQGINQLEIEMKSKRSDFLSYKTRFDTITINLNEEIKKLLKNNLINSKQDLDRSKLTNNFSSSTKRELTYINDELTSILIRYDDLKEIIRKDQENTETKELNSKVDSQKILSIQSELLLIQQKFESIYQDFQKDFRASEFDKISKINRCTALELKIARIHLISTYSIQFSKK